MRDFIDVLIFAIAVCIVTFCIFDFVQRSSEKQACPTLPSKVKVTWIQANQYPMVIDGVMDGDIVRVGK